MFAPDGVLDRTDEKPDGSVAPRVLDGLAPELVATDLEGPAGGIVDAEGPDALDMTVGPEPPSEESLCAGADAEDRGRGADSEETGTSSEVEAGTFDTGAILAAVEEG